MHVFTGRIAGKYAPARHEVTSYDDCGYRTQADRIVDYAAQRTPESVIPFVRDDTFPDGCMYCARATVWESRELPNGQRQTRCTECGDTLTWEW